MGFIGSIHSVGIDERRGRLFKGNPVFRIIGKGFTDIPLKHVVVYTLIGCLPQCSEEDKYAGSLFWMLKVAQPPDPLC